MAENEYAKEYLERKKKLRGVYSKLKETKDVQEIYHKIMGSMEGAEANDNEEKLEVEEYDKAA